MRFRSGHTVRYVYSAVRFVIGGVLFAFAVGFQIRGILILMEMKEAVNRSLSTKPQVPDIEPSWLRGVVISAHRRMYPGSDLARKLYQSWWASMAAFLAALAFVVRFV